MILAAYNPKGGVGKTTTAVNIAASLARSGRKTLLVDLEADLNASISLGVRPRNAAPSIAELLLHEEQPAAAVRPVDSIANLHLITGSARLSEMDTSLRNVRQPERRLADVLRPLAAQFDTIVIDAPAGYSLLAASVPVAAQHLVLPVRAEYLSLESLAYFLRWYRDRRASRKAVAQVTGIVLTMVDYRREATREIVDIVRLHNRRGVFRTEIPDDPRAAEAPSHGIPLVTYASSRGSAAYRQLTGEILKRVAARRR